MTTNVPSLVQQPTTDDHESLLLLLPELSVEGIVFPSTTLIQNIHESHDHAAAAAAAGSSKTLALAGAGVRGIPIEGKFVKFTVIGVYVEAEEAVKSLAGKWKGKSTDELYASVDFFMDIVKGSYDKFTRVTMILPLTGAQYSEKVTENCVAYWKSVGVYTEAAETAVAKFKQTFKDQNFPPGSSILFTHSSSGSLTIAFSKDSSVPEKPEAVIENKAITEAMLESIIGKHGVSPEAKRSLAERLCEMIKLVNPEAAAKDDVPLIKEHGAVNGDVKEITVAN